MNDNTVMEEDTLQDLSDSEACRQYFKPGWLPLQSCSAETMYVGLTLRQCVGEHNIWQPRGSPFLGRLFDAYHNAQSIGSYRHWTDITASC